jgi:hypothetical protein
MVLPISTLRPDVPAVADGEEFLLSDPPPHADSAKTAAPAATTLMIPVV